MPDVMLVVGGTILGTYGVWVVRRDMRRGIASARNASVEKAKNPKLYRALTTFNCVAVGLIVLGTAIEAARIIWRLFSN